MEDLFKKKLTDEELKTIQDMQAEFTKSKVDLGNLEIQKYALLKGIEDLKIAFNEYEKILVDKYGANAVINIKTGEVTEKQS